MLGTGNFCLAAFTAFLKKRLWALSLCRRKKVGTHRLKDWVGKKRFYRLNSKGGASMHRPCYGLNPEGIKRT
jgi:hypothetical protein